MPEGAVYVLYALAALVLVALVVQIALLRNVNRLLSRVTSIRKELEASRDRGGAAQLDEAVAQLQSAAVSLDRIALRCDAIDGKLDAVAQRAPGATGGDGTAAVEAVHDLVGGLRGLFGELADRLARGETDRLGDEVRRALYTRGYDTVTVLSDLGAVGRQGEFRVQVEVVREGVKSKGYVIVRDGAAVETKISPTYEMFP